MTRHPLALLALLLLALPHALAASALAAPALAAPALAASALAAPALAAPALASPAQTGALATTPVGSPSELTFIVAADTHLGVPGMVQLNRRLIDHMNRMPGQPWPAAFGGRVGTPRGVLMAGDLTQNGTAWEWRLFASLYGLTGRDGLLKYPLFEGTGNHDRPRRGPFLVPAAVARRHGALLYAFTWDGVRFLNLDLYPSRSALAFLKKDLARRPASTPLVIYFHYNLVGPYSNFWSAGEKKAFAAALAGRNVLALFHGHFHVDGYYLWNGFQIYNVGSPRHSFHSFCVARITPWALDVGSWDWDAGKFTWWHRRPRAPQVPRSAGATRP